MAQRSSIDAEFRSTWDGIHHTSNFAVDSEVWKDFEHPKANRHKVAPYCLSLFRRTQDVKFWVYDNEPVEVRLEIRGLGFLVRNYDEEHVFQSWITEEPPDVRRWIREQVVPLGPSIESSRRLWPLEIQDLEGNSLYIRHPR